MSTWSADAHAHAVLIELMSVGLTEEAKKVRAEINEAMSGRRINNRHMVANALLSAATLTEHIAGELKRVTDLLSEAGQ